MTIEVKVICDSISKDKKRLTTFELRYPRFIHAEFMTHRVFSRNASSSRAKPIEKVIEEVRKDPAIPVRWGLNGKGMQDHGEMSPEGAALCEKIWLANRDATVRFVQKLLILKEVPHKQIANRLLEPWSHITVVCSGTSFANFFGQRLHKDADPTIQALAQAMWEAFKASTPKVLAAGMWHLPYIHQYEWDVLGLLPEEEKQDKILDLLKVSVSRCARTSYRSFSGAKVVDFSEDLLLYNKLVGSVPMHASPAEHQATPDTCKVYLENGKLKRVWDMPTLSGNFGPGWIQYRQTLEGHTINEYPEE